MNFGRQMSALLRVFSERAGDSREDNDVGDDVEVQQHLREASDAILLLVREVDQLERHKRGVPPNDSAFDELAGAVRVAADRLAEFTREEESWATAALTSRAARTIEESRPGADLATILRRWRAIERELDRADAGSPESARLFDEFERARAEYMTVFKARTRD
jgi:hypothetical protein